MQLDLVKKSPLLFGDVVLVSVTNSNDRAYIVAVAPGHGGLKGRQGMLVNLSTGDTRGWVPGRDIGPMDLTSIDIGGLMDVFDGLDVDSIRVINNESLKLVEIS